METLWVILPFFSTLGGGLFGLKYKNKLQLIMGFTAGVLLGVVFLDLLVEVIKGSQSQINLAMILVLLAFTCFYLMEELVALHPFKHRAQLQNHPISSKNPVIGLFSALALSAHSFLDGVGIGLGFQVSAQLGVLVAIAVVAHDFTDGLGTVGLMLFNRNTNRMAFMMLILDSLAPVLGALSTLFFTIPEKTNSLFLAFFAGGLLYIGAAEVLPEASSDHNSLKPFLMMVIGVIFTFLVTSFI